MLVLLFHHFWITLVVSWLSGLLAHVISWSKLVTLSSKETVPSCGLTKLSNFSTIAILFTTCSFWLSSLPRLSSSSVISLTTSPFWSLLWPRLSNSSSQYHIQHLHLAHCPKLDSILKLLLQAWSTNWKVWQFDSLCNLINLYRFHCGETIPIKDVCGQPLQLALSVTCGWLYYQWITYFHEILMLLSHWKWKIKA